MCVLMFIITTETYTSGDGVMKGFRISYIANIQLLLHHVDSNDANISIAIG